MSLKVPLPTTPLLKMSLNSLLEAWPSPPLPSTGTPNLGFFQCALDLT